MDKHRSKKNNLKGEMSVRNGSVFNDALRQLLKRLKIKRNISLVISNLLTFWFYQFSCLDFAHVEIVSSMFENLYNIDGEIP